MSELKQTAPHDPLCPFEGGIVMWWCDCALIAKVRADERERIAAAILAEVPDSNSMLCRFEGSAPCTCDEAGSLAASIARRAPA